ncbi:hypothetical protein [Lentzea sp. NBRC 102530]|uniref:hypothetical protein n=1 Tax=Lentzea sp. NBRC 102530 TaxID=3032201 RepID=UPI0025571BAC|nr:hypothetical protein [Lentzea sp. NBRC 102530]
MTGSVTTRRVFGAVLVCVAAGLAVVATFLNAYSVQFVVNRRTLRFEATTWAVQRDDFREFLLLKPLEFGEPVVGGAVVVLVSAVLAFRVPALRIGTLLGAGLLVGAAWSAVVRVQGLIDELGSLDSPVPIEVEQGDGVTMLIVAAGLAVIAAVLHQELPRTEPRPDTGDGVVIHQADDADDTDTPPYGYPVIVEPKSD